MSVDEQFLADRIAVSRDVLHGQARIAGTRIPVHVVLDLLGNGKSVQEIISEDYYPELAAADVLACITYASRVVQQEVIVPTV
jgi:uncharacterized protein (DUF433 family)